MDIELTLEDTEKRLEMKFVSWLSLVSIKISFTGIVYLILRKTT